MFKNLLIESQNGPETRKTGFTFLISLAVHLAVIAAVIIIPMWVIEAIPQPSFLSFLASPPLPSTPAPPRPPSSSKSAGGAPKVSTLAVIPPVGFRPPITVPDKVPPPTDEPLPLDGLEKGTGVEGLGIGVGAFDNGIGGPSGIGVPGSQLALVNPPAPVVPPPKKHVRSAPQKVSTGVLQSKLIRRIDPTYPPLAKRAGISGIVILQVTVSEAGSVEDVQVVRGHPLLTDAAVQAVKQWIYSPTLLSGEPVPVTATVTVNFTLR